MNKQLPERPNLDQLKKQAKDLLNGILAQDADAIARVPKEELAGFALADAQRIIAREYGFPNWAKLKDRVESGGGAAEKGRELVRAALHGQKDVVETILREYPRMSRGSIHTVSALGDPDGVRDWLRHDPKLALARSSNGKWSPLLFLCVGRVGGGDVARAECAKLLLAAGANANDYWIDDSFPDAKLPALYGATGVNNYPQLARVLLAAGASPNDGESIYHAAENNHVDCLAALLEAGADLGQRNEQWRNTPLYFLLGHVPTTPRGQPARAGIVWLIEHGANPNVPAYEVEEVPLFAAIRNNWDLGLLEIFLRHGAKPDARRKDGLSLMGLAVRHGRTDVVELLTKHGAPRDVTPLDEFLGALTRGDIGTARSLLAAHPVWKNEQTEAVTQIVTDGARRGKTGPLDAAAELGLIVGAVDKNNETPLHHAALHGQLPAVRRLIALGAPINVREKTYQAPPLGWCVHGSIHFRAAGGDYPAVAEALLAAGAETIPIPREQMSPEMLAVFDRHAKR